MFGQQSSQAPGTESSGTTQTTPPAGTPKQEPGTAPPPGTQEPSGSSTESPPKSKAERLADLLRDGVPEDDTSTPPGGGKGAAGGSQQAKPKKFNDLAETLGVELTDLYKLEVATAEDGSPVTVEQLKDHFAQRADFSVSRLKWEEERADQQAQLVRANAELRELIAALPKEAIDKKILDKVRAKHEDSVNRENAATLRSIPEWRDEQTRTEELAGMAEFLTQYGFPMDYLKGVYDHRVRLLVRTAWKREQRVKAALAEVEKVEPGSTPKSKPTGKAPSAPRSGNRPRGRAGLMALLED